MTAWSSLTRHVPLRRKPLRRRVRLHTLRQARVAQLIREALWQRCGGLCEACGKNLNPYLWHANHRLLRSQGGTDDLCNLTALHPGCHVLTPWSVHQRPGWAQGRGLICLSHEDPAATPLTLPSERRVLLDPVLPEYREVAA